MLLGLWHLLLVGYASASLMLDGGFLSIDIDSTLAIPNNGTRFTLSLWVRLAEDQQWTDLRMLFHLGNGGGFGGTDDQEFYVAMRGITPRADLQGRPRFVADMLANYAINSTSAPGIDNKWPTGGSTDVIRLLSWTHISLVVSDNTAIMYTNGVSDKVTLTDPDLLPTIIRERYPRFYVGRAPSGPTGRRFRGSLRDLTIDSYPRTAVQVRQLMLAPEPSAQHYFSLLSLPPLGVLSTSGAAFVNTTSPYGAQPPDVSNTQVLVYFPSGNVPSAQISPFTGQPASTYELVSILERSAAGVAVQTITQIPVGLLAVPTANQSFTQGPTALSNGAQLTTVISLNGATLDFALDAAQWPYADPQNTLEFTLRLSSVDASQLTEVTSTALNYGAFSVSLPKPATTLGVDFIELTELLPPSQTSYQTGVSILVGDQSGGLGIAGIVGIAVGCVAIGVLVAVIIGVMHKRKIQHTTKKMAGEIRERDRENMQRVYTDK